MTREEAIEVIEQDIPCEYDTDLIEALNMAIAALKAEPCEDCVSREAVLDALTKIGRWKHYFNEAQTVAECIRAIENLPPVTPKQRTGEWNDYYTSQKGNDVFNCKLCGATFIVTQGKDDMNFCPSCGAKMGEMSKCRTV